MKKIITIALMIGMSSPLVGADWSRQAQELLPTVVKIAVGGQDRGSGVIITDMGDVLTAAHLFDEEETEAEVWLYPGNVGLRAKIIKINREADLAVLYPHDRNQGPFKHAEFARTVKVGEEVMAIGNPLRYDWSVTAGIVSYADRRNTRVTGILQSDTSVNPGNSGGPLFNIDGEVVGICSMIVTDGGLFNGISLFVNLRTIIEFAKGK